MKPTLTRILIGLLAAITLAGCNGQAVIAFQTFTPAAGPTKAGATQPAATRPANTPRTPTPASAATTAPAAATARAQAAGVAISQIKMADGAAGWAVGQTANDPNDLILRTVDGGSTWKKAMPADLPTGSDPAGYIATAHFLDLQRAWVLFSPRNPAPLESITIWRTADGGLTWAGAQIATAGLQMDYFSPAQLGFADAENGWMLAHLGVGMNHDYVALYTTQDGGANWKNVVNPTVQNLPMSGSKDGVVFTNALMGWAAGSFNGVMPGLLFYRTLDGGITWLSVRLTPPIEMPDAFSNETTSCGVSTPVFYSDLGGYTTLTCRQADAPNSLRWVYHTVDGGQSWLANPLPTPYGDLQFLDARMGFYLSQRSADGAGGSQLYRSEDGGKSWNQIASVTWGGKLFFIAPTVGWVSAQSPSQNARALVKTTNSGGSWQLIAALLLP